MDHKKLPTSQKHQNRANSSSEITSIISCLQERELESLESLKETPEKKVVKTDLEKFEKLGLAIASPTSLQERALKFLSKKRKAEITSLGIEVLQQRTSLQP